MNKKRKKQRKSFPWLFLASGSVLIVAAILLLGTQNGGGGSPSIAVDQRSIDYGDVKFNTPKTFAIQVTNTGDGTLRFKEEPYIEVIEGC